MAKKWLLNRYNKTISSYTKEGGQNYSIGSHIAVFKNCSDSAINGNGWVYETFISLNPLKKAKAPNFKGGNYSNANKDLF